MATPSIKTYGIELNGASSLVTPRIRSFGIEILNQERIRYVGIHGKQIRAGTISGDRFTGTAVAFKNFVHVLHLVGNATAATINGLSPLRGDAYVVTDSGTLTLGSLSVSAGDLVEYNGSAWIKIVSNSGGCVPDGIRATLSTQTSLISPYTNGYDDGKLVEFDGASNTAIDTGQGHEGAALFVQPSGNSILASEGYFLNDNTPDGEWIKFTPDAYELVTFTCTSTEAINDMVYISGADTVSQADASSASTANVIGWISAKLNDTTALVSFSPGPVAASGLTPGSPVYLSDTAGAVSSSEGTIVVKLGIAKSSTSFIFTGADVIG